MKGKKRNWEEVGEIVAKIKELGLKYRGGTVQGPARDNPDRGSAQWVRKLWKASEAIDGSGKRILYVEHGEDLISKVFERYT